jgi:hypothetical protein
MSATAGLQVGFGSPIGEATLTALRERHCSIVRINLEGPQTPESQGLSPELTATLAQEVLDAGLQPLCTIRRASQMPYLPQGSLVELGNEPNLVKRFGWTDYSYIAEAHKCVALAESWGQRLYLGVVSNLDRNGFSFLEKLPWHRWPETICCSVHRYPDGMRAQNAHHGYRSRGHEVEVLRSIVGNRPLAVSEVGYHDDPRGWTEAQVVENMAWERRFWASNNFDFVIAYQINDGIAGSSEAEDRFGFRRADGSWKPVADAFFNAV